jgi:hypothetical protein
MVTQLNKRAFGLPLEEGDIDNFKLSFESKNTNWSFTTFQEWRKYRMELTGAFIPELAQMNEIEMNGWMSRFVLEARRKDGAPYLHGLFISCVLVF